MASVQLSAGNSSPKSLNVKLSENCSTSPVTDKKDNTFYAIEKPALKPKSNGFRINMIRNSDRNSIRSSDKIVNNDVVIPALASFDVASTNDAGCSAWPTCSVNRRVGARSCDNSENQESAMSDKSLNGFLHNYDYRTNANGNFRKQSKEKVSFEQSLSSADALYSLNPKNGKRRFSSHDKNCAGVTALNLDLSENLASPVKARKEIKEKLITKKMLQKRRPRRSEITSSTEEKQAMPVLLEPDPMDDSSSLSFTSSPPLDEGNVMVVETDVPFLDVDVLYDFNLGFDETAYYERLINNFTTPCRILLEKSEPLPVAVYNKQYQRGPAGYYHDHLFVDCRSECVFCCKCKQMLSLLVFITHSHGQRKLWKSIDQEVAETSIPHPQLFMFVKNSSKDRFDLWCSLCDKVRRFDAIPDDYLTNNLPERLVSTYTEINRRVSLSGADNLPKKDFYTKALNSFTQFKDGAETETPSKISPELVENTSMLTDLFPNMFTDDTSLLDTGLTTVIIPDPIEIDNAAQDTAEILLSLSRNGQNSVQ